MPGCGRPEGTPDGTRGPTRLLWSDHKNKLRTKQLRLSRRQYECHGPVLTPSFAPMADACCDALGNEVDGAVASTMDVVWTAKTDPKGCFAPISPMHPLQAQPFFVVRPRRQPLHQHPAQMMTGALRAPPTLLLGQAPRLVLRTQQSGPTPVHLHLTTNHLQVAVVASLDQQRRCAHRQHRRRAGANAVCDTLPTRKSRRNNPDEEEVRSGTAGPQDFTTPRRKRVR